MRTIGNILRTRREALGWTLADVAARSGLTKGYLSMIENHRLDNPPSDRALAALARVLTIDGATLIEAADWQRTPRAVRDQLRDLEARLREHGPADDAMPPPKRGDGLGRDLDAMYRSGALARQAEATRSNPADPLPTQAIDHDPTQRADVPLRYDVPLINKVAAGYPSDFTDLDYPASVADDYVPSPRSGDPDAFAARVVGDSMWPTYREGDVVVFSPLATPTDGCDCFVRLEPDHETTFKRVYFLAGENDLPHDNASEAIEPIDPEQATHIRLHPLNEKYRAITVPRDRIAGMYRAVWRFEKL